MRNILLLSVFGAIDMAASVAFVMVRLIMVSRVAAVIVSTCATHTHTGGQTLTCDNLSEPPKQPKQPKLQPQQFNVRNNYFLAEMLASASLRDTPTRLSADQLTSFTALRLIAMRVSLIGSHRWPEVVGTRH